MRPAVVALPEVDPGLRDEQDTDPLVEEMVERLRTHLSSMVALDDWGRPVPWRTVIRLAVGPTLARLRDAETTVALVQRVIQLPPDEEPVPDPETGALRRPAEAVGWPPTAAIERQRSTRADGLGPDVASEGDGTGHSGT